MDRRVFTGGLGVLSAPLAAVIRAILGRRPSSPVPCRPCNPADRCRTRACSSTWQVRIVQTVRRSGHAGEGILQSSVSPRC
jgi:hypothetical protein